MTMATDIYPTTTAAAALHPWNTPSHWIHAPHSLTLSARAHEECEIWCLIDWLFSQGSMQAPLPIHALELNRSGWHLILEEWPRSLIWMLGHKMLVSLLLKSATFKYMMIALQCFGLVEWQVVLSVVINILVNCLLWSMLHSLLLYYC
jgi:hypothetical protein